MLEYRIERSDVDFPPLFCHSDLIWQEIGSEDLRLVLWPQPLQFGAIYYLSLEWTANNGPLQLLVFEKRK